MKNNLINLVSIETPPPLPRSIEEGTKNNETTRMLLETKRPTIGEIELTLFENCHLNCSFCHHDKKSTVGLAREEILSKVALVEDHLIKLNGSVDTVQINMVGGELLQDRHSSLYDVYEELLDNIHALYKQYNYTIKVVWVTSFQFSKRELVKNMIDNMVAKGIPSYLIASYDFDGRPLKGPYAKNIDYFADYIISINMVATTESINKFMAMSLVEDNYFNYLYDKFDNFYFDDYIPDKGEDHQIPSDSLYLVFLKFVYKNYPDIAPFSGLIENDNNEMHCMALNKVTIFPDNSTSNCRWDRYDDSDFNTPLDREDNTTMMQNYMEEYGCLSCKWYNKCGFRCYTQWDWKNRVRDLPDCVMRMWFNYMDENENILHKNNGDVQS
jgi:hypothetical protein